MGTVYRCYPSKDRLLQAVRAQVERDSLALEVWLPDGPAADAAEAVTVQLVALLVSLKERIVALEDSIARGSHRAVWWAWIRDWVSATG